MKIDSNKNLDRNYLAREGEKPNLGHIVDEIAKMLRQEKAGGLEQLDPNRFQHFQNRTQVKKTI